MGILLNGTFTEVFLWGIGSWFCPPMLFRWRGVVVKSFCAILRMFDLLSVKLFHILLSQSYISCWGYYFMYRGFVGFEKMNCFENMGVA